MSKSGQPPDLDGGGSAAMAWTPRGGGPLGAGGGARRNRDRRPTLSRHAHDRRLHSTGHLTLLGRAATVNRCARRTRVTASPASRNGYRAGDPPDLNTHRPYADSEMALCTLGARRRPQSADALPGRRRALIGMPCAGGLSIPYLPARGRRTPRADSPWRPRMDVQRQAKRIGMLPRQEFKFACRMTGLIPLGVQTSTLLPT